MIAPVIVSLSGTANGRSNTSVLISIRCGLREVVGIVAAVAAAAIEKKEWGPDC
jgi:hypothetical protein